MVYSYFIKTRDQTNSGEFDASFRPVFGVFVVRLCVQLEGGVYSRDEARQTQTVEYGQIDEVRPVIIEGTQSGIGALWAALPVQSPAQVSAQVIVSRVWVRC